MIDLGEVKKQLASKYVWHLILGKADQPVRLDMKTIVSDLRSRRAAIKELGSTGYCTEDGTGLTDKAYKEVRARKPRFLYNRFDLPGVMFNNTSVEHQKYIIENFRDYFLWFMPHGRTETRVTAFPITQAGMDGWKVYDALYVADTDVMAARELYKLQTRLAAVQRREVSWGLAKLGILSVEDAALLKLSHGGMPTPHQLEALPLNTENLGGEIERVKAKLQTRIQGDQTYIAYLDRLQSSIDKFGGWDTFFRRYREEVALETMKTDGVIRYTHSSEVAWELREEAEWRSLFSQRFWIDSAKKILTQRPRRISVLNIYGLSFDGTSQTNLDELLKYTNVDVENVKSRLDDFDTGIPVIAIPFEQQGKMGRLVIDGWKRIIKLMAEGKSHIACVDLTDEEASQVRT